MKGGFDRLKSFVARNEIRWPRYHQGHGADNDFSRDFGVNSIPIVFLADPKGKLHWLDAGSKLETLIPELMTRTVLQADGAGGR